MSMSIYADSWYCKRNKDHKQPLLDEDLSWISNYNAYWCDLNHTDINAKEKVIYLTFDAGYENGNIEKILDVLKNEEVNATFFILDNLIYKNPELVKRMTNEGHIVANHTLKHKDITKMSSREELNNELNSLEKLYKETIGEDMPKYFRPPEGKYSKKSLEWVNDLGYKTIFWSFAYADWDNNKQPSETDALKKIFDNLHNGEIMLLHPTSLTNAKIMERMIKEIKQMGFKFGSLDEL